MFESKGKLMIYKLIAITSAALSYISTVLMLLEFGNNGFSKFLYAVSGAMIDGIKWILLIAIIKAVKTKIHGQIIFLTPIFIMFAGISISASIAFSIYNVTTQLYDVKINKNPIYATLENQKTDLKKSIDKTAGERDSEVKRLNNELDSLPKDHVTRRNELENKKIDLKTTYDQKLEQSNKELMQLQNKLSNTKNDDVKIKTLKETAVAQFFQTISNVTKVNIDVILSIFAIILGVALDLASLICTYISEFTYSGKREFNKEQTQIRNIRTLRETLHRRMNDNEPKNENEPKINNYNDFLRFIEQNKLDPSEIKYENFKNIVPKTSFYKYLNQYTLVHSSSNLVHKNMNPVYTSSKPVHENMNPVHTSSKPVHESSQQFTAVHQ